MATEINAEDISSSTIDPLSVPSAEEINNNGSSTVVNDVKSLKKTEAEEFGFQRPEMFSLNLSNTVDPYHRHMFLVYKNVENWEPIIEKADKDSLPGFLAAALHSHAEKTTIKTRMTICEGPYGTESSDGDVFLFPEMVKYRGLTSNDVDKFVEDVLVNGKDWVSGTVERLEGSYVFVCSHGSRDKRCGVCGPELTEKFKEEIELRGMKDQVFVAPCSLVGGHKYAGNLIIFSRNSTGEVTGHWYGYAAPEDVPAMLDQHIGKGDVIQKLWRGEMLAFPTEDSQKVAEERPESSSRRGSCILGYRNPVVVLLGADSMEIHGVQPIDGVTKLLQFGKVTTVRCGVREDYLFMDRLIRSELRRRKRVGEGPMTASQLAVFTYTHCSNEARILDCEYLFASIEQNPDWVSYGPPLPQDVPMLYMANQHVGEAVPMEEWHAEGSSAHLALEVLLDNHTLEMELQETVNWAVKAYLKASTVPCTGGKIKIVAITVDEGYELVVDKDVDVLRLEMDD
ncbi:hypothetical protein MKW92_010575 [Papaver armeniacum]|nr:hypothetical protein MKW92_010575 [Papaver armeniacum]